MAASNSRWFRVIADRFDWMPKSNFMLSTPRGAIGYGTRACIEYGLSIGAIEQIAKPKNARVGKDGRVVFDAE